MLSFAIERPPASHISMNAADAANQGAMPLAALLELAATLKEPYNSNSSSSDCSTSSSISSCSLRRRSCSNSS